MIELRGSLVTLRTLERDDCRRLWEAYDRLRFGLLREEFAARRDTLVEN